MSNFINRLKKIRLIRNKYVVTSVIFIIYILFLDDADVFSIVRQQLKIKKLKYQKEILHDKYQTTKSTLNQLNNEAALERYARENKFFKRDNEDIFVIVEE